MHVCLWAHVFTKVEKQNRLTFQENREQHLSPITSLLFVAYSWGILGWDLRVRHTILLKYKHF